MEGTYIDSTKAPRPPKATTKRGQESQRLIAGLSKGKVLQVRPADGQTVRGVKVSLVRAANNLGTKVETWDIDGVVYAELAD